MQTRTRFYSSAFGESALHQAGLRRKKGVIPDVGVRCPRSTSRQECAEKSSPQQRLTFNLRSEEPCLNLVELHRSRTLFVVIRDVVDASAHGITLHHSRVEG